ncbi:hypothetical protein ACWEPN_26810 [Nonomuraea wenchangensis]
MEGDAQAKGNARAIFLILEARGLSASDEMRNQVLSFDDQDILAAWVVRAITIETAEALFD